MASELSDVVTTSKEEEMKEKLLSMALDELVENPDLLEWDVPPHLRKSADTYKPKSLGYYDPYRQYDEEEINRMNDDVYGHSARDHDPNAIPAPYIDLSDRDHRHFDTRNGKIFAYNMPYTVTDDDLQTLFSPYGRLIRAAINYTETGQSRGTAFIVYHRKDDAMKAFRQLDGHFLDGRKMLLKVVGPTSGCRDPNMKHVFKIRGDQRNIDNRNVFEDKEMITPEDLDMDLDEYMQRRKRAKTWNYY